MPLKGLFRTPGHRKTENKIKVTKRKITNVKSANKFLRGEKMLMAEHSRATAGLAGARLRQQKRRKSK